MADDHERAIDRAQKLLRLASPTGGATEAERSSAALEAAKIIAEHGLAVAPPPPKVKRRRERPAPPAATAPPPSSRPSWNPVEWAPAPPPPPQRFYRQHSGADWTESALGQAARCGACGRIIEAGEPVWHDSSLGVRHYDITCDR